MFCYIYEFEVVPAHLDAFTRDYGDDGPWVKLFAQDPAYRGTELHRDADDPHRFVTIDHWTSRAACLSFRERFRRELDAILRDCQKYKQREVHIGDFERVG